MTARVARQFGRRGLFAILMVGSVRELPAEQTPPLAEHALALRSGPRGTTMFKELAAADTGIQAENRYADPEMWGKRYQEFEVGSIGTGVAIGDYDGDGRPDIFAVSKTESCRLFRNLGGWKFEDVTEKAGVGDKGAAAKIWKQGAALVDVNNDGRLDIYVCRNGAPNLLYINQGDGTFKEMAHAYGLDVNDGSVMASFCDYDCDGWLDVYLVTNLLDVTQNPNGRRGYLFHHDRDGTFKNVSDSAGISRQDTQSHSATWWDYDNDGWPDLYVANDFSAPDRLYHNNRDGTFTDVIGSVTPHMPFSSMGADLGDVDNDGRIDFFVADMAATAHQKDQRGMADSRARSVGKSDTDQATPQLLRNMLYLNTGTGRTIEAAYLAGIAATDWTWSARFEDLDNDGRLDLHITNGMNREQHNSDLLARMMTAENPAERVRLMHDSPLFRETHLAYRNLGDLRFEEVGAMWGLNQRGVSFGAAFGDLDGDGDQDIVYANYEGGLTVLRNDCDSGHRVEIDLHGTTANRFGIGATVRLETDHGVQVRQLTLARGYASTSEPMIHFGLGTDTVVKQLTVTWPGGKTQKIEGLSADRRYTITEPAGTSVVEKNNLGPARPGFVEVSGQVGLAISAPEQFVDEIAVQRLLPMRLDRRGPALAVGDLTADGLDSIVIGGTTLTPARILRPDTSGHFSDSHESVFGTNNPVDDGPILIFDADSDGYNDLLVTKGGNSLPASSPAYQPRLFLNDGRGNFRAAPSGMLPSLSMSAGAAVAADFDRDGRLDLFIGARVTPGQYPETPRSALLANKAGKFEDVTDALAPALREVGMVTSALWTDVDGDGWPDLLIALEWGMVKCFHNQQGRVFEDWTEKLGFAAAGTGWWTSLATADFNGDGRPDYVVGNLGLNTPYRADATHPAMLFHGDFAGDGSDSIVEGYYEGDRLYPRRSRRELGAAIPSILKRFPRNDVYARATLDEILGKEKLAAAQCHVATELRSGVFFSQPDGTFHFNPLPRMVQIAPLQGIGAADFDGDGKADLYAVQNSYAPIPSVGRFDGGLSQLLRGDGRGNFAAVPVDECGLVVVGDAKGLAVLDLDGDGWPDFVATRNNDTALAFRNQGGVGRHSLSVRLRGPVGNRSAIGAVVILELSDGSTQRAEVSAGSSYYSQSSASCFLGWTERALPKNIRVTWPTGLLTTHAVSPDAHGVTLAMP